MIKQADAYLKEGKLSQAEKLYKEILKKDKGNYKAYHGLLLCYMEVVSDEELIELGIPITENNYYKNACYYSRNSKKICDLGAKVCETTKKKMYAFLLKKNYKLADAWKELLSKNKGYEEDVSYVSLVIMTKNFEYLKINEKTSWLAAFKTLESGKNKELLDKANEGKKKLYDKYILSLKSGKNVYDDYIILTEMLADDCDRRPAVYALEAETENFTNLSSTQYNYYFCHALQRITDSKEKELLLEKVKKYSAEAEAYQKEKNNQITYDESVGCFNRGEWQKALDGFNRISTFKDSASFAKKCEINIEKEIAKMMRARKKTENMKKLRGFVFSMVLVVLYLGINFIAVQTKLVWVSVLSWSVFAVAGFRKKAIWLSIPFGIGMFSLTHFTDYYNIFCVDNKIMGSVFATLYLCAAPFVIFVILLPLLRKKSAFVSVALSIAVIFSAVLLYIPVTRYAQGIKALEKNNYASAAKFFAETKYLDSEEKFNSAFASMTTEYMNNHPELIKASVGDTVKFGEYRMNVENNEGPLEWIVIAKEDGKMLLLTKDIIDWQAHGAGNTWEKSQIREFLNKTFYDSFSYEEKAFIVNTKVITEEYKSDASTEMLETADNVFLLSIEEVEKYLPEKESRIAYKNNYAAREDYIFSLHYWSLRSKGYRNDHFTFINGNGDYAEDYRIDKNGVRPCIWIKTNCQ